MPDLVDTDLSPAERRRHRVRQTILAAAERVFGEEGETGLSIRRLADEVDYSPGAIYKYFGSKQELVDELKEGFFARILERVQDVPVDRAPFLDYARRCIRTYISTALERPHHYAAAFSGQTAPPPEDGTPQTMPKRRQAFAVLHQMVQEGVKNGTFCQDLDVDLASKSIWASAHGLATLIAHIPHLGPGSLTETHTTNEELIEAHAEFVIQGLMA